MQVGSTAQLSDDDGVHTVADVGGPPAAQAPEKNMAMTAPVGGDLATVELVIVVGAFTEDMPE
jgi:hypothetical protein